MQILVKYDLLISKLIVLLLRDEIHLGLYRSKILSKSCLRLVRKPRASTKIVLVVPLEVSILEVAKIVDLRLILLLEGRLSLKVS